MRILVLGLDPLIVQIDSPLAKRLCDYGKLVQIYDALAPGPRSVKVVLSETTTAETVSAPHKALTFFAVALAAIRLLRRKQYDLISVQDQYYLAFLAWMLARLFGIGFHLQIHGWERFSGLRARVARFVLPRADAVRVVSQRLAYQLVDEFGVSKNCITSVPIMVEFPNLDFERAYSKPIGDHFVFLSVGRLVPVKNITMLINAFKLFMDKVDQGDTKVELHIVGDGPNLSELQQLSCSLGLSKNVIFQGWLDKKEIQLAYQESDVFILSSWAEGWSMATIEAASFSLPIVMTDVGLAGEIIINEKSGLIIPTGDVNALANNMQRLFTDEILRQELGTEAKEAIQSLPGRTETIKLYVDSWKMAAKKTKTL